MLRHLRLLGARIAASVSSSDHRESDAPTSSADHGRMVGSADRDWTMEERYAYHNWMVAESARIFAQQRAVARTLPGFDAGCINVLDGLLDVMDHQGDASPSEHHDRWVARIQAMGDVERRDLFRHLRGLHREMTWGESRVGKKRRLEDYCERITLKLVEIGFPVDRGDVEDILSWLAHEPSEHPMRRIGSAGCEFYQEPKGVMREIADFATHGPNISERARADALIILDRYHGVTSRTRDAVLARESTIGPVSRALHALAGRQADTFFQRMRRNRRNRAVAVERRSQSFSPEMDYSQAWANLLAVIDAARTLIADIDAHYAGKSTCPTWLDDPVLFERMFGPVVEEPSSGWGVYRFGWWRESTIGQPGFWQGEDYGGFRAVRVPGLQLITRDELSRYYRAIIEDNGSTFVYTRSGMPDAEAWTFGGRDPEGALLDHAVKSAASKPSTAWLKTARAQVDRIGREAVRAGLERWTSYALVDSLGDVDMVLASHATRCFHWMRFVASRMERSPAGLDRQTLICRCALDVVYRPDSRLLADWQPRVSELEQPARLDSFDAPFSAVNERVMRGAIWLMALYPDDANVAYLEKLGRAFFRKREHSRSKIAGNAVLWALGQIGTSSAVYALARIRRTIQDKTIGLQVDRALEAAGRSHGLSLVDMQDVSMADYGVGRDGTRVEMLGPHKVTLSVVSSRSAVLRTLDTSDARAKEKRGITKAALAVEGGVELAAELKEAVKDIALLLPEARHRLESSWRHARHWSAADWRDRYLDNGLVATLTQRLIWRFTRPDGTILDGIPQPDGTFLLRGGGHSKLDLAGATVRLWHPIDDTAEGVAVWREILRIAEIRQPFMQAWRPNYVTTDAERTTATYSNRFAGHILHQPPLIAMLRKRGWTSTARVLGYAVNDLKPTEIRLPAFGIAAQYWFAGIGDRVRTTNTEYGMESFDYVTTDRLVFCRLGCDGQPGDEPIRVEDVPTMALSEVMRDIDLAIGITSIGADRFWVDRGDGAPPPISAVPGAQSYRRSFTTDTREIGRASCRERV